VSTGFFHTSLIVVAALFLGTSSAALAQDSAAERQSGDRQRREAQSTSRQSTDRQSREGYTASRRTTGIVTSVGRGSMVVRTDEGRYIVYTLDRDTQRQQPVSVGARVSVVTFSDEQEPSPIAQTITVLPAAQGLSGSGDELQDPVPPEVRRLETQIERQARRYRAGVQVGAALDPELISFDGFATFGPFFSRNAYFRPNVEFAFGEVTTLFGIHLDGIYMLPGITRSIRWAPYVGAGPSFSFSHRGFEDEEDGQRFDFGEFEWHNGVNFIVGARNPNGVFFEMKSTAWGAANIRLLGGFEF
jgi:hypothetical protein